MDSGLRMAKLDVAVAKCTSTCTAPPNGHRASGCGTNASRTSPDAEAKEAHLSRLSIACRHEVTSHSSLANAATRHSAVDDKHSSRQLISNSCWLQWPSSFTSTRSSFSSLVHPFLCSSSSSSPSLASSKSPQPPVSTSSAQLKMPRFNSPLCVYLYLSLLLLTLQSSNARQGKFHFHQFFLCAFVDTSLSSQIDWQFSTFKNLFSLTLTNNN